MNIAVLSASHRQRSRSGRVAKLVAGRLAERFPGTASDIVDLADVTLPFWDDAFWSQPDGPLRQAWRPLGQLLAGCDGLIVVTPEWHGMVPPKLKNLFLYVSDELFHKPGLIVSVSASQGGAYPVTELRISSYKNSRLCWIPEHVIVRNCKRGGDDEVAAAVGDVAERLDHALDMLCGYAEALKPVRAAALEPLRRFPYGM